MAVITREDFAGKHKKNDYVLAYFKEHNLGVGDKWNATDYINWIQNKHDEFHRENSLPEYVTYWKGHNEDLLEKFLAFIGFVSEI